MPHSVPKPVPATPEERKRFSHVAAAGIAFQASSTAVDSSTVMAALLFHLTGNPLVVGAATTVLRFGWLFPQLFVGYLAERRTSSMRYYIVGGFGRAMCMLAIAAALYMGAETHPASLGLFVLALWTAYAFVSGVVAVPYNDIVARSVASARRSRLLAVRFFGGGILALGFAMAADVAIETLGFPLSFAAITGVAGIGMFVSAAIFVAMGEPRGKRPSRREGSFTDYLRDGIATFRSDRHFRLFVLAQWCGGVVLVAMPFYIVQATHAGVGLDGVAQLLAAQTVGALLSNVLWGWWGDRLGKASLLRAVALGRMLPPAVVLVTFMMADAGGALGWLIYLGVFFALGALGNGLTIAVTGFLMEISPDDRRPSYSGFFNALTAPAFLMPVVGGWSVSAAGLEFPFAISLLASVLQFAILLRVRQVWRQAA